MYINSCVIIALFMCFFNILNVQSSVAQQATSPQGNSVIYASTSLLNLSTEEQDFIQNNPTIKVANELRWIPFDYYESGKAKGFCIDYIELLLKKVGLEIEYVQGYSWAELLSLFKQKKIDLMPVMYRTKEREGYTLFSDAYHQGKLGIFSRTADLSIATAEDLIGKRVGIQKSDGGIPIVHEQLPGIQLVEIEGVHTIVRKLATKKIDAIIGNPLLFYHYAEEDQISNIHLIDYIETNKQQTQNLSFHVGVRKDLPVLDSIIAKAMDHVRTEELQSLKKQWFNVEHPGNHFVKTILSIKELEFIEEHPEIVLASGDSFEPFTILNNDGSISGFDVDIMELVTQKTGLKVAFSLGNWKDMQEKAQQRQLDGLSSAVITKSRKEYYNFSIPYHKYYMLAIVKKGNPQNITVMEDLEGKRVALQTGNQGFEQKAQELGRGIEFIYFDTIHELIKAVVDEKADFTLLDETANYIAQTIGLENSVEVAFTVNDAPNELVFALRNDYPELLSIVNKALRSIDSDEIFAIRKKWFGNDSGLKYVPNETTSLTAEETVYLKHKEILKICSNPDGMPYEQISPKGNHEGMGKDFLTALTALIGVQTQLYSTATWAETLQAIQMGKCDLITLAAETTDRLEYLDFTSPLITTHYGVFLTGDKPYVTNLEEIVNEKFAVVEGGAVRELLLDRYPTIQLLTVSNTEEGLEKLKNSEVYGFVGSLAVARQIIHKKKILDVRFSGKILLENSLRVATRSDEPILHDIFQKAVSMLEKDKKEQINNKWIAVSYEDTVNYSLIFLLLAVMLVLIGFREITIQHYNRKLKREILTKTDELKNKNEILLSQHKFASMGEMIANIAHQWRQPLASISGIFLNMDYNYKHRKLDDAMFDRYCEEAELHINYMSDTIRDFMYFFSSNKVKEEFDVAEIIRKSKHILGPTLKNKHVELVVDLQKNMIMTSYPSELMQVILTLLNNSKDALVLDTRTDKKITIVAYKKENSIHIRVSDNGGGINDDLLSKIFDPYFTTKHKSQGVGLGLYIAKLVIEKSMGGSISAHNDVEGTLFKITL